MKQLSEVITYIYNSSALKGVVSVVVFLLILLALLCVFFLITWVLLNRCERKSHQIEEEQWVKIADHVLLSQPPEKAAQQKPGDSRHNAVKPDP